ncbi:MAG TPA: ABC transporter permease [Thermomicrobiales bacterium]|nr:ABC transporter permease [Thermomicrobiales bacterium]
MIGYLLRRIVQMAPVLFLLTLFVFFLVRLVPGDPAEVMLGNRATPENLAIVRKQMGLDRPIWEQYVIFLGNAVRGDLGKSVRRGDPVTTILVDHLPPTLFLSLYAMALAVLISVPLATWAALHRERTPDQLTRILVLVSLAMPTYWVGMMLLQFFAVKYKFFPVAGYGDTVLDHFRSLFLPAFSLGLATASIMTRALRNSILETIEADYVRTARAKGLTSRRVLIWHVLRNSVLSTVTILGISLAFLIGGTTIIETIFAIPGLGQLIVKAIFDRDYPIIQGATLAFGVLVLAINLLTDVSYALLDPRVSYQ